MPMLSYRQKIMERIGQLLERCGSYQFRTAEDLPKDRSFAVGMYQAWLNIYLPLGNGALDIAKRLVDGSGSSIMAMWFLSQTHAILQAVGGRDAKALCDLIEAQLVLGRKLPIFFQGDSDDVHGCPPASMGWYPLIDGYRLPSVIADWMEKYLLDPKQKYEMANLSDVDIWAWCMSIKSNHKEDLLEFRYSIDSSDLYAPLLGSCQEWDVLHPESRFFYDAVIGSDRSKFPLGSFYNTFNTLENKYQRFTIVVISNTLASIPLLEIPDLYLKDIQNAVDFIQKATHKVLNSEITWHDYAYDYCSIHLSALMYVAHAHKRILEIKNPKMPILLDESTLLRIVEYVSQEAERYRAQPDITNEGNALGYANLVCAFNTMMNLRFVHPNLHLFKKTLIDDLMELLLIPNPSSDFVIGTGPFPLPLGARVEMASIAFVSPLLIEALALYLLIE